MKEHLLWTTLFAASCNAILGAQASMPDLANSSMEELTKMEISISSVSRKEQRVFDTPAAAYVITRDDIEHSTASSIPELLRSVPGLQVAQLTASVWAISARGFNNEFANKLLVLIDGRTVYSEIYSGEHWDEIDLPLPDVERIEVVRGPGAVVWGTNAVNGVINIITRSARAVSSPAVSGGTSRIDDRVVAQQGGTLANGGQYRGFVSFTNRKALESASGASAFDGEQVYRLGARADFRSGTGNGVSIFGDAYGGPLKQQVIPLLYSSGVPDGREHDFLAGGSALLRVDHSAGRNASELQAYSSVATRHEIGATAQTITEDLDFVDHYQAAERLSIVAGGELRLTQDLINAPVPVTTRPSYANYLIDGFVQGEFSLVSDRLTAVLGSKVQDGTLAGFQVQPSGRLAWKINPSDFLWGAVSKGVVAPALQEKSLALGLSLGSTDGLPLKGVLTGNPAYQPEVVTSAEAGYRRYLTHSLLLDLAGYFNNTQKLQSIVMGSPSVIVGPTPFVHLPLVYHNGFYAHSQGLENSLEWHPNRKLELRVNYSWLQAQVKQTSAGPRYLVDGYDSPRNTFAGLGRWTPHPGWTVEGMLYKVSAIQQDLYSLSLATGGNAATTPGYTRLDVALERRLTAHGSVSAGGNNLTQTRHVEFNDSSTFTETLYVPRNLFVRAGWNF